MDQFLNLMPEATLAKAGLIPAQGNSPSQKGFIQRAQGLLKKDFDVNSVSESGLTLLHVAALNGHHTFVEKLFLLGADILAKDTMGNTALHLATWAGHYDTICSLIAGGAPLNEPNAEGNTPLHFAAQYGKEKRCAKILVEKGAFTLLRNKAGETPLELASRFGKAEIVGVLASRDDLKVIYRDDRPKSSPFHLAARSGYKEICGIMLQAGVSIDLQNIEGNTALHEATKFGKKEVVLFLLQRGANPLVANNSSDTPLDIYNAFNSRAQGSVIQNLLIAASTGADATRLGEIAVAAKLAAIPIGKPVKSARIRARAVMPYAGSAYDPEVLALEVGDIITVLAQPTTGWWRGTLQRTGATGDFKPNFVELLPADSGSEEDTVPDDPEEITLFRVFDKKQPNPAPRNFPAAGFAHDLTLRQPFSGQPDSGFQGQSQSQSQSQTQYSQHPYHYQDQQNPLHHSTPVMIPATPNPTPARKAISTSFSNSMDFSLPATPSPTMSPPFGGSPVGSRRENEIAHFDDILNSLDNTSGYPDMPRPVAKPFTLHSLKMPPPPMMPGASPLPPPPIAASFSPPGAALPPVSLPSGAPSPKKSALKGATLPQPFVLPPPIGPATTFPPTPPPARTAASPPPPLLAKPSQYPTPKPPASLAPSREDNDDDKDDVTKFRLRAGADDF